MPERRASATSVFSAGHVGVQARLGGHLKELHLCGRLAVVLGTGQDGPALQDTAAMLRWLSQLQDLAASPDPRAARRLKEAVEGAPEAEADDSNAPDYYAMRALSVVAYAAEAWFDDDPVKFAQWSADEAVDLMRDIAFTLGKSAPPLEALEVEAQRQLLGELERASPEDMPTVLSRAREAPIVASSGSAVWTTPGCEAGSGDRLMPNK
jgi:hypothetical protein